MKKHILFIFAIHAFSYIQAQMMAPESTELYMTLSRVTPGVGQGAPSDAIVLFDGQSLSAWQTPQFNFGASMQDFKDLIPKMSPDFVGKAVEWKVENGDMVVNPGKGAIATKQAFGDLQLHIEWLAPEDPGKKGQQYSNSGLFLMGMYEIQILNSFDNETYNNSQAGSVYKQYVPLVNASKPVGEWQYYDVIFNAPKFSEKGTIISPARVTILHNGVLIQNSVPLLGPTCYIGSTYYIKHADKLPIILQDHGDAVRFRNIWVREL